MSTETTTPTTIATGIGLTDVAAEKGFIFT